MSTTVSNLWSCLLPAPDIIRWNGGDVIHIVPTRTDRLFHWSKNIVCLLGFIALSPLTLCYDYFSQKKITPLNQPDLAPPVQWPPAWRGFASSFFQLCGLGLPNFSAPPAEGANDWDEWIAKNPNHIDHPDGFDFKQFFTDVLSNPEPYVAMLKAHKVTAHRFSFEWAVLMNEDGTVKGDGIELYKRFLKELIRQDVKPHATLCHFTLPKWLYDKGGFTNPDAIGHFLKYANEMMERFPEIEDWWSFNELGVKSLQQTREQFPPDVPEGSPLAMRVDAAARATRNMLIAHCKLHAFKQEQYPGAHLGVTHQWLRMDAGEKGSGNIAERIVSFVFEKFAFEPVYRFFKEGHFAFEVPFMANIRFETKRSEFRREGKFLERLGVQAYPKAMVKIGLNHGQTYPGLPETTQNGRFLTFGGTCEPDGTLMRFGPRWKAGAMQECLDEAFELTDQVFITEFGADANVWKWGQPEFQVDREAQKEYLQQLVEQIQHYPRQIQGIFCWSDLTRQLEWKQGHECRLGLIEPELNGRGELQGWQETPASTYLTEVYRSPLLAEQQASA